MRPLYETDSDLNKESKIARFLEVAWGCSFKKLPIRYALDFALTVDDTVKAFCEIKTRNYSMKEIQSMGGYMLSIGKWMAAKQLSEASGLPFVLIVCTTDALYQGRFVSFKPDSVSLKGRKDRNDWQDIEPCILLNANQFKRITNGNTFFDEQKL